MVDGVCLFRKVVGDWNLEGDPRFIDRTLLRLKPPWGLLRRDACGIVRLVPVDVVGVILLRYGGKASKRQGGAVGANPHGLARVDVVNPDGVDT